MKNNGLIPGTGRPWMALGVVLSLSLANGAIARADDINPDADEILRSMSSYLAATKAFSVNADIDFEIVTTAGEKLQFSSYATVVLQRPNQLYIQRQGALASTGTFFDGETLTLFGQNINAYAQFAVPGTIDEAIQALELETGIPAPGADLLFADPYVGLADGVQSSSYLGTAYVNGIECYHLAFRERDVDWQIWVQTGDQPLPLKYVITTKWITGSPQYQLRLRDWNTNPQIAAGQFTFSPPAGATQLEALPASELADFTSTQEGQ
jgi:hypothetical protein